MYNMNLLSGRNHTYYLRSQSHTSTGITYNQSVTPGHMYISYTRRPPNNKKNCLSRVHRYYYSNMPRHYVLLSSYKALLDVNGLDAWLYAIEIIIRVLCHSETPYRL